MTANKSRLVWSADAEDDLIQLLRYGAREWSQDVSDAHGQTIWQSWSRLLQHPELGRLRDDLIPGLRSIVINPHVVFYRVSDDAIEIVRVIHQREDTETVFSETALSAGFDSELKSHFSTSGTGQLLWARPQWRILASI